MKAITCDIFSRFPLILQVLFFSDPIVQAAKSVKHQIGDNYASWHLRLGDTFVRDSQRRAAEKNQTTTMEQIAREASNQVFF